MNVRRDQRARRLGVARHPLPEHARDLERVLVVEAGLAVQRARAASPRGPSRRRRARRGPATGQPERAPAGGQELERRRRPARRSRAPCSAPRSSARGRPGASTSLSSATTRRSSSTSIPPACSSSSRRRRASRAASSSRPSSSPSASQSMPVRTVPAEPHSYIRRFRSSSLTARISGATLRGRRTANWEEQHVRKHFTPGVALGVIAIVLAMSGSAVAGSLITSAKIKDGTIQNKDIKKGTIALDRTHPGRADGDQARRASRARPARPARRAPPARRVPPARRAPPARPSRPRPAPTPTAGNWGVINRNTEGSPAAYLRSGPLKPPLGKGALNLTVKDGTEKVAFGNEIDTFAGGLFANVNAGRLPRLHDGREQRQGRRQHAEHHVRGRPERRRQVAATTRRSSSCRRTPPPTSGAATSTPPRPASGA